MSMAELPLDDVQRHALPRHLDGMGMAKLMRCETPPNPCPNRQPAQRLPGAAGVPGLTSPRSSDDAEEGAQRERASVLEPWRQLLPTPLVHPDLAALATFAFSNDQRTAYRLQ